jgi:hypothetical protein
MHRSFWVLLLAATLVTTALGQMEGSKDKQKDKGKSNTAAEQKIEQMEKGLWEAWKNHDMEPFKRDMAAQSVNVGSGGVAGTEQALKDLSSGDCKVASYSLSDTGFTWFDKNTVMVTYKANQDATCNGQKVPEVVWASSLWTNKGGQWKAAFHQETPAQSAMEKKSE